MKNFIIKLLRLSCSKYWT